MGHQSRAEYQRELRARSFAAGKCYQCCHRPHREGKKTCAECYGKMLSRRNADAARGMCREQCGQTARVGFSRCETCLARRLQWGRARAEARRAAGLKDRPRKRDRRPPVSFERARLNLIRARAEALR